MGKKVYWFVFALIVIFSFLLRVVPSLENNFYFTVDQGDDAIWVREILERGRLPLRGPATSIPGIHTGPLWYWLVALGYSLFAGHPFGGLLMVIVLNISLVGILMWVVKKYVGAFPSLALGIFLNIFWWFYDTSRWSFNPFPLVFLAFLELVFLARLTARNYILALFVVFLAFNFDVAGAFPLLALAGLVGFWAYWRKVFSLRAFTLPFLIPLLMLLPSSVEFAKVFYHSRFVLGQTGAGLGVFAGTSFLETGGNFLTILSYAVFPYKIFLSLSAFVLYFVLFVKRENSVFVRRFVFLGVLLFVLSFLFFGLSKGWRDWHTPFLPSILFVCFLFTVLGLGRRLRFLVLGLIVFVQVGIFYPRYMQYFRPSSDFGLLANKLLVLDWIYQKSEGDGFNAYMYTSTGYDLAWQYLFWWYGRKEYGFVPCEYTIQPGFLKAVYLPSPEFYTKPALGCDKFRFFIIEPGRAGSDEWLAKYGVGLSEVERGEVGEIEIVKMAVSK